jgi:hypothetical protein
MLIIFAFDGKGQPVNSLECLAISISFKIDFKTIFDRVRKLKFKIDMRKILIKK